MVVKLKKNGTLEWQKCLGGSNYDDLSSIQQTVDGGYIVAGYSGSNDGDVSVNQGIYDYWVVKLKKNGTIEWQKSLGGSNYDIAYSVQQTADSGYIVAGLSDSNNGDVSGNHGDEDYWIVKLKKNGNIEWQKSLGGSKGESAGCIQQTVDGGYIIAGSSSSNNGDVSGNHGGDDYWIVKLRKNGTIQWQKSFGGSNYDYPYSIQQTVDGGYIVAGLSLSNDGDVSGNHGAHDYWVIKLKENGVIEWQKSLGGSNADHGTSIQQTADGGYIVAGHSYSTDGDVSGNHGSVDYWIVKLKKNGAIKWQKSLGGSNYEYAHSIQQTTDGGYIVAGQSGSNDGDVSGNHGIDDYWVVKLGKDPSLSASLQKDLFAETQNKIAPQITNNGKDFTVYPNPATNSSTVSFTGTKGTQYTIEVTDFAGTVLQRIQGISSAEQNSITLNLIKYAKGMYFINLVDENGKRSVKLSKQ